jgi:hypothetical protein
MEHNVFNQNESYEEQKEQLKLLKEAKSMDKGHNVIYRYIPNKKGKNQLSPINVYTSGRTDSNIRDAETGAYYNSIVGSADEDLFFKVILATGECKSKNGSTTLFYISPNNYMSHLNVRIDNDIHNKWQIKHDMRIKERDNIKNNKFQIIN